MSYWIKDRLPQESDSNEDGDVYLKGCNLHHYSDVQHGELWHPLPKLSPSPRTREDKIQDLLDAIDTTNVCTVQDWANQVKKVREELR